MSTSFPKSYILERIDARMASLNRTIDEAGPILEAEADRKHARDREWLVDLPVYLRDAATVINRLKLDTPERIEKALAETVAVLGNLQLKAPSDRTIPWNDKGDRRREELRTVENARTRSHIARDELVKLEHARAYLVDTPVDEFSWTALKALGLLDAVRFDLGEAIAQSKSGSRRR